MKTSLTLFPLVPSWLMAGLLAVTMVAAQAQQTSPDPAARVGEVTLALGQALIVGADGASTPVQRGSQIRPGDRVETAEGGHVHIRFVDGALVSVRPTSRLVVEDYQYNPAQVAQSLVRFRLEKGVARAISGAAAEGARDRFRLNTPLVAIGVRGTDFVVRTQAGQTLAAVNQGAIVMAPFGEGCQPQATGPCGSAAARLLTADMGNMLVEFRYNLAQPEIKPFGNVRQPDSATALADQRSGADAVTSRDAAIKHSSGDEAMAVAMAQGAVHKAGTTPVMEEVKTPVAVVPSAPVVVPPAAEPGAPPAPVTPVVPATPPAPAQLAWGRWGASLDVADATVPWRQASQGRAVTVGNDDYILYRNQTGANALVPSLGNVSFALQQGQAHFTSASNIVSAATVQSGNLSIDFSSRTFSTALNVNSAATGNVGLQAGGFVRDDGIFNANSGNSMVAGAAAFDGKTAAYLFEKAAAGGTLSGITLWSR